MKQTCNQKRFLIKLCFIWNNNIGSRANSSYKEHWTQERDSSLRFATIGMTALGGQGRERRGGKAAPSFPYRKKNKLSFRPKGGISCKQHRQKTDWHLGKENVFLDWEFI
ncbi:MAG: hypothetical protein H0V01_15370 [Bacteroidetes bacterium]|nr:hypothetical protein [Bacteroidota bacterium]HET6243927.1 hypothetical protein [Bacteroidia bacterium]